MRTKEDFIAETLGQIRWKKAHESVQKELSDHIDDQKNAFIAMNMSEEEAMEKAVAEMGDPVEVGTLLDSSYRPHTDKGLIFAGVFMMLAGIIISGLFIDGFNTHPLYLIGFMAGIPAAFLLPFFIDASTVYKHIWTAIGFYIIFLLLEAFVASRTRLLVRLVTYSAFIMPPLYAVLLCRMRGRGIKGLLTSCALLLVMTMLQLSMAGGVAFTLISFLCCLILTFIYICKGWYGSRTAGMLILLVPCAAIALRVLTAPETFFLRSRIKHSLFPQLDPLGSGWATLQAREVLSRSVFWGSGAGESVYNSLPGYNTDYALTSLIHRFGFAAAIVLGLVIVLFMLIVLKTARKQTSQLAGCVSYSVLVIFLLNSSIYFLINLGIIGTVSTCPTFLFGGKMSMIVNAFLLGILASTNRNGSIISDNVPLKGLFKVEKLKNKLIITFGEGE